MTPFVLFIYLQLLDLLTTMAALKFGGMEGNPIVRFAMSKFHDPVMGLLCVKFLAVFVGGVAKEFAPRSLVPINWMFAVVVVWNLIGLLWGGR